MRGLLLGCLGSLSVAAQAEWSIEPMRTPGADGQLWVRAQPIDPDRENPWPPSFEAAFQARGCQALEAQAGVPSRVNTYFENEKRTYGFLMAQVLGGDRERALEALQVRDHQHHEWHRETCGIDYYAAFTLKHQMRKYFYFGDLLAPAYRQQMFDGARAWTAQDPMRRPHYAFKQPKSGWGPDAKNSWVDVRHTENLFLMRETSVYLMAEETGNRQTMARYKKRLLDYTATLYRVGIGEWDSENYHGHSLGPLLNLHDFSKDPEIQAAAKACLDWFCIAGAVKYWRGAFTGPTKRDYNHAQPFGGSAATLLWLWFGDTPAVPSHWESDEIHLLTSSYRPPRAVVDFAQRRFRRPLTLLASKPPYSATTRFDRTAAPEHLETQYFGHDFQIGSLAGGTSAGASDVNGFKILLRDATRGAVALQGVPGPDARFPGSPQYQDGKVSAPNRVAQDRNLAIWLVQDGSSPWRWVAPASLAVIEDGPVTFLRGDGVWVAIHPLNAEPLRRDEALTRQLVEDPKTRFPDHQVIHSTGRGGHYCGMVVRVADQASSPSFDVFRRESMAMECHLEKIQQGIVRVRLPGHHHLGLHWQDDPRKLGVWRSGVRHDWARHQAHLYLAESPGRPCLHAPHGSGKIFIEAAGQGFASQVAPSGKARFLHGPGEEVWQAYSAW